MVFNTCKNLCSRYRAFTRAGKSFYYSGSKRCSCCMIYLNWEGMRCPCCNAPLRMHPKRRDAARRLNIRRSELDFHIQGPNKSNSGIGDAVTLMSYCNH